MILVVKTSGIALFASAIFLVHCHTTSSFLIPPTRNADLKFSKSINRLILRQRSLESLALYTGKDSSPAEVLKELDPIPESNLITAGTYFTVFGILPVLSFFTFDWLLSQITDFNLAPADRQLWIIALLLSKRLYIYAVALTTVDLASKRSVDLPGSLGQVISNFYLYPLIIFRCLLSSGLLKG